MVWRRVQSRKKKKMKEKRRVLQAGEEKKKSCSARVCEWEQRKAMCFFFSRWDTWRRKIWGFLYGEVLKCGILVLRRVVLSRVNEGLKVLSYPRRASCSDTCNKKLPIFWSNCKSCWCPMNLIINKSCLTYLPAYY